MRAETWSALFQLVGVVGALGACWWARMPLMAARLRLRTTVDLEIENLSRAIARQVTVEMSSDEPFEESDRIPSNSPWKWGLGDIGPGQQFSCSGITSMNLTAGVSVKLRWKGSLGLPRRKSYNFGGPALMEGLVMTRKSAIRSSGNPESKDAKAIVAAIRDHAQAVIDYSD